MTLVFGREVEIGRRPCRNRLCPNMAESREDWCMRCQIAGKAPDMGLKSQCELPPLVDEYSLTCVPCARSVEQHWTAKRAQLEVKANRFRCPQCRGVIVIERQPLGVVERVVNEAILHGNAGRVPVTEYAAS